MKGVPPELNRPLDWRRLGDLQSQYSPLCIFSELTRETSFMVLATVQCKIKPIKPPRSGAGGEVMRFHQSSLSPGNCGAFGIPALCHIANLHNPTI